MTGTDELSQLGQRITGLEGELHRLGGLLDDVTHTLRTGEIPDPAGSEASAGELPAGPVEPMFASLTAYVEQAFAPVYSRPTSPTMRWCPSWWDHAEAIYRLEALWRTWELYRLEPRLGIASWLRDYLDPQLTALTSPTGPFAQCTEQRHRQIAPFPTTAPPDRHFDEP